MAYSAITRLEFRTSLKYKWEEVPFWTDTEANQYINETLRVWNLLTGQWKRREIIVTTAGTVYYPLTASLVYNIKAQFAGYPVDPSSLNDMNNGRPNWQSETTASGNGVPSRVKCIIPLGLKQIAIWPADAAGSNSLIVDSVISTPAMTNDADYIDIGQEEFNALQGYCLHIAAFKQSGSRWKGTFPLYRAFIKAAGDKNERFKASALYREAMGLDANRQARPLREPADITRLVSKVEN